jgi:prepilin-type N-terminal cleavage/methylation domain-containing protein
MKITRAFTLIELLVVIAIIGILVAVGTPVYQGFIEDSREAKIKQVCSNVRSEIEYAILSCKANPDATLPIISTAKKIPCSWGNNGIAIYMYQKHTAIAKTIPHPYGWGPVTVVGFNKGSMPFRSGHGLLANTWPVAIKFVNNQKYDYIEVSCNDVYNPPHPTTVTNHGLVFH